jgi:hypothetical protein
MHTLVIAAMFKNEGMIIGEWVRHHLECGVSHFYLIDNGSTDNSCAVLQPFIKQGQVTLISDPRRFERQTLDVKRWDAATKRCDQSPVDRAHTQMYLLNEHFLEQIKQEAEWVWVIDIDEYVFSTVRSLQGVVRHVPDIVTEIWAPWRIFGSSGIDRHPASIRSSFVNRMSHKRFVARVDRHGRVRGHGKTCTRVSALRRLGIHQCELETTRTLLPDGKTVTNKAELSVWFKTWIPTDADTVQCNHYMVMSWQYFVECKTKREGGAGRPNGVKDMAHYWAKNNANDVADHVVQHAVRVAR